MDVELAEVLAQQVGVGEYFAPRGLKIPYSHEFKLPRIGLPSKLWLKTPKTKQKNPKYFYHQIFQTRLPQQVTHIMFGTVLRQMPLFLP